MKDELIVISPQRRIEQLWDKPIWRLFCFLIAGTLVGAVGGIAWANFSPLPSYTVLENLTASMSERGQASIVGADVYFAGLVALIGLIFGLLGWSCFHRNGFLAIAVPLLAAITAAIVCWRVGLFMGPSGLSERLAQASPGDVVVIDLELRSLSALLIAPLAAITPIMLLSAFWPEADEQDAQPMPEED